MDEFRESWVSFPPHMAQQNTTIVRVRTFLRPAKAILVPGMYFSASEGNRHQHRLRYSQKSLAQSVYVLGFSR
jgi:hypothetical protein